MEINVLGGFPQVNAPARPPSGALPAPVENAAAVEPSPVEQHPQARAPMGEAVSSIKQFAQSIQRNLNFVLDDSTGRVVVKVTDGASGELIRQIPSEDALRLAESLEEVRSLLFKAEA